jgi:OOP family OmpA-OmpF porin
MRTLNYMMLPFCVCFLSFSVSAQNDVAEEKAHPLLPAYPGSVVVFFDESNSGTYELTLGPLVRNSSNEYVPTDTRDIKGKLTNLQYMIKDEEFQDVVKFYEDALKRNGFELVAFKKAGKPMEVAGRNWTLSVYDNLPNKLRSNIVGTKGGRENRYYIVGQLNKPAQNTFVAMIINEFDRNEIYVHADIIGEGEKIEKQDITDAETIEKDLKEQGYSVIYGIYFEQDKAEIQRGSELALNEIAKYLKTNPGVFLYVIGHTDMVGKLDFKVALSKSRADAVAKVLTSSYFIAPERLVPEGVGPLSPVATNQNLEGRKKNERIELVLRSF